MKFLSIFRNRQKFRLRKAIAETEDYIKNAYIDINKKIYPKSESQIEKGAEEVLYILNNSINEEMARGIFMKSTYFVELIVFGKKRQRLKEKLFIEFTKQLYPTIINEAQSKRLLEYMQAMTFGKTFGWGMPVRRENGGYAFYDNNIPRRRFHDIEELRKCEAFNRRGNAK